ncbi:TPA: hypothetical protein N0F65_011461 [Lagenidium giganteum]|uniref:Kinesin motor domain-containing protein n=1 Tax=Lagenidium giganteum TaxID=4803 RepID=A0AAV2ZH35_9STRA|nr:TPA: hypothetical protein N0F65_011461 [Lagenidium giganteum]
MSISVPPTIPSPSHALGGAHNHSARSSPHTPAGSNVTAAHANAVMRRMSIQSQHSISSQASSSSSSSTANSYPVFLQRTAISNAYQSSSSRGDDETLSNTSENLSLSGLSSASTSGPTLVAPHALASPASSTSSHFKYTASPSPSSAAGLGEGRGSNFKVVIRVRPPLPRELHGDRPFQNVINVDASGHVLTVSENLTAMANDGSDGSGNAGGGGGAAAGASAGGAYGSHVFSFDHVYDQHCTQRAVYENTAKAVVESSLEGYNATIFAYGQTGTGKTYTMEGFNSAGSVEERGIIPRAIEQIFCHIQANVSARNRFLVRASYLQIYNESISDLLKPERNNLTIREDKKRGVFVEGLSEWVVRSPEEIYGLMERGGAMRATGSTKMNEISSRSHAVFIIIAEQSKTSYVDTKGHEMSAEEFTALVNAHQARYGTHAGNGQSGSGGAGGGGGGGSGHPHGALHPKLESMIRQSFKVGKLNLVDLAGSERVRLSGATGQRLEESKKINQSLSALGNVIAALTDARGRQHIPYRDSKLTRILEDSLGGNCKTTMMAMISPALEAMVESLSTLKFANRAKNIKNEARVNEDLDQKSLLRKYERELKRLRAELEEKSRNVVDKRRLLELDEQRRRAEEDKMAAIRALEERSREFMREKEEKKKLEQRISMLTSQMLMSSQKRSHGGAEDVGGMGGASGQTFDAEDPLILEAIKEHQDRIRKEYECRLADLEKERETIEEEKAQVDRYKQLLLKQRDIMIALTQRLNERDEQITALQDELDAYDRHQKELEEKLDEKTAHLIHLQRVTMEQHASSPGKPNSELLKALGDWAGSSTGLTHGGSNGTTDGGKPAISPEHLITHKQFRPHGVDAVVYATGTNNAANGKLVSTSRDEPLLSAEEKMQELKKIVDNQAQEHTRLAKELEEVKAEKVSVEFLLRERLEKLVQVEMESRLKHMVTPAAAQLQDQLNQARQKVEMLENENRRLSQQEPMTPACDETQRQLQTKCETLVKERRAVQTIMEQKIKTLVNAISEASDAALQSAGGADRLGEPAKWLTREVNALQRLVNASIVALRNADSASNSTSVPSSSHQPRKVSSSSEAAPTVPPTATSVSAGGSGSGKSQPSPVPTSSFTSASPPSQAASNNMSVEELIQQRRAQLQRDRQQQQQQQQI